MTPFPLGRPARMAVFASGRGTNLEALLQARRRGAEVKVLLETRNLGTSREGALLEEGLEVRQDANPYTMHHKVMLLDGTYVVTGSYNFSVRAHEVNNENLLVLKSPSLAERYRKEVLRLWEAGSPL